MDVASVVTERRAPWWRTALLVACCAFASLTSLVFSELGQRAEDGGSMLLILVGFFACLLVPLALIWRHRAPYTVALTAVAAGIVLPLGASTALVALASLVGRRRGADVWWTAGAVAVTTTLAAVRDVTAPTMAESLLKSMLGPVGAPPGTVVELNWWVVPVVVSLGMGAALGVGLALRARREARESAREATTVRRTSTRLGDELARQVERERIAREVHDVLGHRLSLLNLHAGALEANARGDADLARSAALVRESAGHSLDDLRSLLAVLRHPMGDEPTDPDLSLVDLQAVIEETVETGVPVSATVYLDRASEAEPALARAVYRIVQEMLTNARKHAPEEQIRLSVVGGPGDGVRIDARNRYLAPSPDRAGAEGDARPGQGLQGIAERAELLGGRLAYGLDDGGRTFRVTVTLPWGAPLR
ncbi:sensor histidine kinase [Georgenia faecalis]|uniref:histidine kinase n=1 Tax=Georgenia faecalis TaxID=2483799 RepID=A0ABV9DAU2_9MICO|nr:histidine kinase [Georgenia faecalis]